MEQFSKIYLLQSEAALFDVRLQFEVANHRFSKRLLKCEKIVMCCDARRGTTRFARDLAKAVQTSRLLRVSSTKFFAKLFFKKVTPPQVN